MTRTGMTNVLNKLFEILRGRIVTVMTTSQATAFQNFLAAWRRRDDARHGGSFTETGQSRIALERERTRVHSHSYGTR